jgi:transposase-like protein
VLVALGIDEAGQKQPLGLWLGVTENAAVCGELLNNLVTRGLDPQQPYLFVIDGGKGLRRAIKDVFGKRSVVQRCQEHKRRNVLSHLPKRLHPSVNKMLRDAYGSTSEAVAKKRLLQLVAHLTDEHPDAAASLREGLEETLTLKDMKLPLVLERTLATTNPIENLNGGIRRVTRNVKRWRDGTMVKRWVATSVLESARGFRRLRGFQGMPTLVAALRRGAEQITRVDGEEKAA